MKPTITVDKPTAAKIRFNEGARNEIMPARQANTPSRADVIKVPAPTALTQNNRTHNDNRSYNDYRTYNDNRSLTEVTEHTSVYPAGDTSYTSYTQYNDSHDQTYNISRSETNSYSYSDSHDQTYNVSNYTAYTDNSTTNITNIDDHSQHWTDNSRHLSFTSVNNTQSVILALFFGDGLEKVLLALVMLGILITIFLTELLLIAGGLATFAIAYKTAKFAWQRHEANINRQHQAAEAEKQRRHELELAKARSQPVLHIHVNNAEEAAKVVKQMSKPQAPKVKQPAALPEPTFFEADAPSAVSPTRTEKVKAAAKKHAKKQANLFIDGMKHDVIGMSRKGK